MGSQERGEEDGSGWRENFAVKRGTALVEDLTSILSTHIGLLTTARNSSSIESGTLFWFALALHSHEHLIKPRHIGSHIIKNRVGPFLLKVYSSMLGGVVG